MREIRVAQHLIRALLWGALLHREGWLSAIELAVPRGFLRGGHDPLAAELVADFTGPGELDVVCCGGGG